MPALYLHIPFCAARCHYCDFNTYAGLEAFYEPYVAALGREIRGAGEAAGRPPARTIFIGGGTPTVLPIALLEQALEACFAAFDVAPSAEITCEANPGTVDQAYCAALRGLGVNRLSLGAQSFDDGELRWLGRIHTAADAQRAFSAARAAGFENINLDLIYGLPETPKAEAGIRGLGEGDEFAASLRAGRSTALPDERRPAKQSRVQGAREIAPSRKPLLAMTRHAARLDHRLSWQRTLSSAVALGPEHLSLYSLTVERDTPLGRQVRRGQIAPPDDDLAADLYQAACNTLAQQHYAHYEISNWARAAGQRSAVSDQQVFNPQSTIRNPQSLLPAIRNQCQHNLVYWRREPYMGFGAGAHSFDGVRRSWNVRPVARYIERVEAGRPPRAGSERIGRRLAMGETMMLGLRLLEEGVSGERFRAQYGCDLDDAFGAEIDDLVTRGLLERLPDRVRLSPAGMLLGNRVFAEFMEDDRAQGARRGR
jgi:coproporphyrinogen III oxidase-like Fe-S oxidoreductase